jgi:uncharacterized protein (TIGR02271 family)
MRNYDIREGMTVRSSDGEKLGKVIRCDADQFLIEKGFFFPKDYAARYDEVSTIRDDEVLLAATAESFREGAEYRGAGVREESSTLGGGASEQVRIPIAEEELDVQKHRRKAGEVEVRKQVVTEHKEVSVPVTREEVHVERVPAERGAERSGDARLEGGSVSIPLHEEEVEVRKRPVVREEVRVSKTARQEERRADADVRREEADVERKGDVDRLGEPRE